ncbi:MAG: phospholipase D-like domain-containing protein [Oscillospiraceae bacterium]|nr:phospholipase D-like domain-containing protein [Oscillospiraceae bacterium]
MSSGSGNGRLYLLKKGRNGLLHSIFSRLGLVLLLLLLQIGLLIAGFNWFAGYLPHVFGGQTLLLLVMLLYLVNCQMDVNAKITWLVIIALAPVGGTLLLLFTRADAGHRALRRRLDYIHRVSRHELPQDPAVSAKLEQSSPEVYGLSRYLWQTGDYPVYWHSQTRYYTSGQENFAAMLNALEKARQFIFLEYFIINEGQMWGQILDILARKAKAGVEVRVLYDGTNEFYRLPADYPRRLAALDIKCQVFAPLQPLVSTHYNYRDHRKIVVVDGEVAFTGGFNLADEYINKVVRYGYWKDTGIMVRGEAVQSFTLMFLQMWHLPERPGSSSAAGSLQQYICTSPASYPDSGFIIPYGDCPLDDYEAGKRVYLHLLNQAKTYVHIMTPYLILDEEMENALKYAAARGVEVILILPGIPDKIIPYALAKTHYKSLLTAGVRIYEYAPGFVHAKVMVSDSCKAVVGTINFDYRSLYHHFECAALLFKDPAVEQAETDFIASRGECREVTLANRLDKSRGLLVLGYVMKVLAPLL